LLKRLSTLLAAMLWRAIWHFVLVVSFKRGNYVRGVGGYVQGVFVCSSIKLHLPYDTPTSLTKLHWICIGFKPYPRRIMRYSAF